MGGVAKTVKSLVTGGGDEAKAIRDQAEQQARTMREQADKQAAQARENAASVQRQQELAQQGQRAAEEAARLEREAAASSADTVDATTGDQSEPASERRKRFRATSTPANTGISLVL